MIILAPLITTVVLSYLVILSTSKSDLRIVSTLDDSNNEIISEYGKCEHGELSDHKIWNKMYPLLLEYDEDTRISCLEVIGQTSTILGGLMDNKIKLNCLVLLNCEVKVFTQSLKKCPIANDTEEFSWPNKNSLNINFPEYLITCVEIIGAYQVYSGGIGFSYATIKCLSNSCLAKIYKEKLQKCEKGKIVVVQNWTNQETFIFESKKVKILCMEVTGKHKTLSGKRRNEIIELKCFSPFCEVALFAETNYGENCERSSNNLSLSWNKIQPFQLNFEETDSNSILCFIVSGPYNLVSGGLLQNHLTLQCLSEKKCEVIVYLKKPHGYQRTERRNMIPYPSPKSELITRRIKTDKVDNKTDENNSAENRYARNNLAVKKHVENKFSDNKSSEIITNMIEHQDECKGYILHEIKEWDNSKPLIVVTNHKIKCLIGSTEYETLAGGIGFYFLITKCISIQCSINVYVEKNSSKDLGEQCNNFTLYVKTEWNYTAPLKIDTPSKIECFKGGNQSKIVSGGIGAGSVIINCLSYLPCNIEVYVDYIDESKNAHKCHESTLYLKKEWNDASPLVVNLRHNIECFKVDGQYTLISGGTGTKSIVLECAAFENCTVEIHAHTDSNANCTNNKLYLKKDWTNFAPLAIHLPKNNNIDCFDVEGEYDIISGGVNTNSVILECTIKNCTISLYVGERKSPIFISEVDKCNGDLVEQKCGDKTKPITIKLKPSEEIHCIFLTGAYKINSGGIGQSFIELFCLEQAKDCCISVYSIHSVSMNVTEGKCSYGNFQLMKSWKEHAIETIDLLSHFKIVCYNIIGAYKLITGGLGSSKMEIRCKDIVGCVIEIFTVRSRAQILHNSYFNYVILLVIIFYSIRI